MATRQKTASKGNTAGKQNAAKKSVSAAPKAPTLGHLKTRDGKTQLTLEPSLNIAGVKAMHRELKKALSRDVKRFEISGAAVEVADTASIQLLLAFCKTLRAKKDVEVAWTDLSDPLSNTIDSIGLKQELVVAMGS